MHPEAMAWLRQYATLDPITVLDLGGRNINGSPRALFPNAAYTCNDISPGPEVDIVANAATWTPIDQWDLVIAAEVFEHTGEWPAIVQTAYDACKPGGRFVATMAGPGRPEHSAIDGGWTLYPGEHYGNVDPHQLRKVLEHVGFVDVVVDQQFHPCDVRCTAVRP